MLCSFVLFRTGKKLEGLKAENGGLPSGSKSQKKKEKSLEDVLKRDSFDLQKMKMSATICVSRKGCAGQRTRFRSLPFSTCLPFGTVPFRATTNALVLSPLPFLFGLSRHGTLQSSVVLLILYTLTSRYFNGMIVAKLPFEAPWLIKGATQRGISTEDLTDCSMTYIYVVCSAGLRPNIQKLLGFTPPRQASMAQQNPFEQKPEED